METSKLFAAAVAFALAAAPAAAAGRHAFTDAEILGVVGAANQGVFDAADRALGKTRNADVRRFAEAVRKDHGDAKQYLVDVEAKAGLTPADTELSNALTKRAADEASQLDSYEPEDFDAAYLDEQVSDHASLLRTIDEDLVPSADDPLVAALLHRLRPVYAHHLAKARRLRAELESRRQ